MRFKNGKSTSGVKMDLPRHLRNLIEIVSETPNISMPRLAQTLLAVFDAVDELPPETDYAAIQDLARRARFHFKRKEYGHAVAAVTEMMNPTTTSEATSAWTTASSSLMSGDDVEQVISLLKEYRDKLNEFARVGSSSGDKVQRRMVMVTVDRLRPEVQMLASHVSQRIEHRLHSGLDLIELKLRLAELESALQNVEHMRGRIGGPEPG